MKQPRPRKSKKSKEVYPMVIKDLKARYESGKKSYGVPLMTHNGRDALQDLYEEILDAAMYARQIIEEIDYSTKKKK